MPDYEQLLERARKGEPKSSFTPYMTDLCQPASFTDTTRLRLLGNAIANSEENAAILVNHSEAVDGLLKIDPLGLQVLFNGTVNNPEFSKAVVSSPSISQLRPSPSSKNLLGSIWESLNGEVPKSVSIELAANGFLELLIQEPELETDLEITKRFADIFAQCQKCSLDDESNMLGIQVAGNITSHKSFTPELTKSIRELPYSWETVAVLANVTAEAKNLSSALELWPDIVSQTIDLIKSEDPEEGLEEDLEEDLEKENLEEEEEETPFDLQLWGPLFRNITRDFATASKIASQSPASLYKRLLSYPQTRKIGHDFVVAFSGNVYDDQLAEMVLSGPKDANSVAMASSLYARKPENSQRIADTIVEGLLDGAPEAIWVKGTKTLAIISESQPNTINTSALKDKAPESAAVENNLKQIK